MTRDDLLQAQSRALAQMRPYSVAEALAGPEGLTEAHRDALATVLACEEALGAAS